MGRDVQDAILDHVRTMMPSLKRLHVTWYGGEPTLDSNLIMEMSRRLIAECKTAHVGYQAFMVTNGYLLSLEKARQLLSVGVNTLQVTLDGPQPYHDQRRALKSGGPTYERIVTNLKEIFAANIPLTIMVRVNIDERNRASIPDLLDDLSERGLGNSTKFRLYFAPVRASTIGCHSCSDVTLLNRDYGLFESKMYDYAIRKKLTSLPYPPRLLGNCQAVRPKGMIVLPDGQLHKCWDTVSYPELGVGSIFATDRFPNDLQHKCWLEWTPFNNEACLKCTLLPSCMGFCAYKHLFRELTRGEAGSIPCPSWKYNVNERLFLRARWRGFVKEEDWDQDLSPTIVMDGDIPLKSESMNDSERIRVNGPVARKSRTKRRLASVNPGAGS
jgi:uncharacterized protein